MRHIRLIAGRELIESFRSRAYWVTIGLMVAAVVGAIVLPRLFEGETTYTVGVVGDVPAGIEAGLADLIEVFDAQLEIVEFDSRDEATLAVDEDEVDAALVFTSGPGLLLRRADTSETLVGIVNQVVGLALVRAELDAAGLDPETIASALNPQPPVEVVVDDGEEERAGVSWAISFLLYITIFMGGMSVAQGVAIEKSTRIAEVLVTTVRPVFLLTGKILGLGVAMLIVVLCAVVPFTVAIGLGYIDVPAAAAGDVVMSVGWFILGYALYATGFAVTGALVDRQEDLGAAIAPFSTAVVLAYFASIQALADPSSTLARITSIFPFSAPMVMPVRIADGSVPLIEVLLAVALGLATLVVLARVGGTIYRRALLRGGQRLKLRDLLRA